jgi:hypothetical protein
MNPCILSAAKAHLQTLRPGTRSHRRLVAAIRSVEAGVPAPASRPDPFPEVRITGPDPWDGVPDRSRDEFRGIVIETDEIFPA